MSSNSAWKVSRKILLSSDEPAWKLPRSLRVNKAWTNASIWLAKCATDSTMRLWTCETSWTLLICTSSTTFHSVRLKKLATCCTTLSIKTSQTRLGFLRPSVFSSTMHEWSTLPTRFQTLRPDSQTCVMSLETKFQALDQSTEKAFPQKNWLYPSKRKFLAGLTRPKINQRTQKKPQEGFPSPI